MPTKEPRSRTRSVRLLRPPGAVLCWLAGWIAVAGSLPAQVDPGPPPAFLADREAIATEWLGAKKDGWYLTGFPALGGDSEYGFNGGLQLQIYDNGPRDSSFFAYTPYRKKIAFGATAATAGRQTAFVTLDVPNISDSPWRVRIYGGYLHDKQAPYFGLGTSTLGPLTFPGSPEEFSRFPTYQSALDQVVNGETWERYIRYDRRQWTGAANLEYSFLGGRLRPMFGLEVSHVEVEDYTGQNLSGAIQLPTKLYTDNANGLVTGFNGGWDNAVRFGVAYDTRDYEPDPTRGLLAQFLVAGFPEALGSAQDYGSVTAQISGFQPLLADRTRLVLAMNAGYSFKFGDVPFYAYPMLPLPGNQLRHGLGGWYTLRGFNNDRFVGKVATYASTELRWTFAETTFLKQHLKFALAPFVDAGRVYDGALDFGLNDWKVCGGAGLRLAWNLATIISVDVGVSRENTLVFAEIGHQF